MSDTALIVIDVQESFRHRDFWDDADLPAFLSRQQALIDGASAAGIPVIQIFHVADSGPFSEASGFVTTLAPLRIAPDAMFRKRRHSALVGTGLDVWLTSHGIRRLIISGIRSEQCCETTTRHASDLGYAVDYVGEATLTFPMTDASGRQWSAADIRARTELVLAGRFARIATVEQALAGQTRQRAA
jgi:nicotinamidase-related amidase